MTQLIQPRVLKGFRDYLPAVMIPRERLLEEARKVYRSYGFAPIDTPALEYAEILLGKGGEESDKITYRFTDHGDRDVAMRFDLTVPFARFAAMYIGELGTPFKRYAMGPVWRGENTGHGRFREFWQSDFDIIGATSNAADVEIVLVIYDLLRALGVERFQVRVNNRLVLNGMLEQFGLAGRAAEVLRALDKLPKVGPDAVVAEMGQKAGASAEQARRVLELAGLQGDAVEILDRVSRDFGGNATAAEGVARLRELVGVARAVGIPAEQLRLDLSIARGLDYYTGTIYETFLQGTYADEKGVQRPLEGFGSVCSGGRYDNLAELYTRQKLPGVGASLGVDRLVAALESMGVLPKASTAAPVLVVQFTPARLADYQRVARRLRAEGVGAEVYPEAKKIGQQLKYAEQRGFKAALIAGDDEFARGEWKVKNLASREEITAADDGLLAAVLRALG
jgi:histidyl-tRNA synthetase